jgi:hypothetical protein
MEGVILRNDIACSSCDADSMWFIDSLIGKSARDIVKESCKHCEYDFDEGNDLNLSARSVHLLVEMNNRD